MSLNIPELKQKWKVESKEYQSQEVGSGVQRFVKDVLLSEDLFRLSMGKLSTNVLDRSNEFTEESRARDGRKADIVIYVSPDIVVPVEVEKFGHIVDGEGQLKQYQLDFEKQYGILTDGNEWRFYNNNLYRTFYIDEILKKPDFFLSFWTSYTQPLSYYVHFFEPLGQQKFFDESEDIPVEKNRIFFFEDITKLIQSFAKKINVAGYLEFIDEDIKERKAIELTYAYIIQFILYKTLVDNEFDDFKSEFEARVEDIKESIKAEHYKQALATIRGISDQISKNIYRPFAKEQAVIGEVLEQFLGAPRNNLSEIAPWLDIFVFVKKYNFSNVKNDIFGYIYENYLKDLYSAEQKGQYFTDPAVVDFMLDEIGYTKSSLRKSYENDTESLSIIDPSCGSGTFLYSATNRIVEAFSEDSEAASKLIEEIVNRNIFGLDIEEFPLYLAEMNILMRLMPFVINEKYNNPIDKKIKVFKTKDSISEFMDTAIRNTLVDANVAFDRSGGQTSLFTEKLNLGYSSYVRDEDDLNEMKKSLENQTKAYRRRFDYVIGNPPYISYNQSAKQKLQCIEMIKSGEMKMNDIYGVNLNSIPGKLKTYPPKPNLYAFFIALGWALLKDGGRLCYIIPQTLLTANDLDVLRHHLSSYTAIEKIIIFKGKMFVGRGIKQNQPVPTSSLVIVFKKAAPSTLHEVEVSNYASFMGNFNELLEDKGKRNVTKILQGKLKENQDNWNFITKSKKIINLIDKIKLNSESFDVYRLPEFSVSKYGARFYFDVGFILDKTLYSNENRDNYYEILDFKNFRGFSKFSPDRFYPSDHSKIQLTRSNQGHITLSQKYSIVWRIKNPDKFYFTDRRIIFNMGTASIITSDSKSEMVYLLAVLNSPVAKLILDTFLRIESEKEFQVAILPIKKYIRVPVITTGNKETKEEIIKLEEELLSLDSLTLSDIVDFKNLQVQKFDSVEVTGNKLILTRSFSTYELDIKSNVESVKKAVHVLKELSLLKLKSLPLFSTERQILLKDKIDNLIFKLYKLTDEEIKIVEAQK